MIGSIIGAVSDVVDVVKNVSDAVSSSDSSTKPESQSDFATIFRSLITPDAGNNVNEEELFAALARERVKALKGDEAAAKYDQLLESNKAALRKPNGFVSHEELGIKTLKDLRAAGTLSAEEADQIYSESFEAAQLDGNKTALFDSRGGPGDSSIAMASTEKALADAKSMLEKIAKGELKVGSLSLDQAAPNIVGSAQVTNLVAVGDTSAIAESNIPTGTTVDGANGFLFKPISSNEAKLAILLPEILAHKVSKVVLKDALGLELETGRSTGYGELGTREKFAFSKQGGGYPSNLTVEATLADGSIKSWSIPDPSKRYD